MSKAADEYRRLAKRHSRRAETCSPQLRALLEALGDTYEVIAQAQDVLDDKAAVYRSPDR
jgi:hypothetical protein